MNVYVLHVYPCEYECVCDINAYILIENMYVYQEISNNSVPFNCCLSAPFLC